MARLRSPNEQAELDGLIVQLADAQATADREYALIPPARFLTGSAFARYMIADARRTAINIRIDQIRDGTA
jgi:hypothetical protein